MEENSSLYSRLKKLFSTNVIVRNVGGKRLKVADTDSSQFTMSNAMRDRYSRIHSGTGYSTHYNSQYGSNMAFQAQRLMLFRDYDCVSGDTQIPLPDGSTPTIKELASRHGPDDTFYVFSYDLVTQTVKLGVASNVRSKGVQAALKVTFDDGQVLTLTADHPVLLRNGEYRFAGDIEVGDRVMPFYRKDFYKNGYRSIYNFARGWQSEHRLIAEQFDRPLVANEVVHHMDFDKTNNAPDNLHIMDASAHKSYHAKIVNGKLWSAENRDKQIAAIRAAVARRKPFSWNGVRQGSNNPFYGKSHSQERNINMSGVMKERHATIDSTGANNPNFRDDISFDDIRHTSLGVYADTGRITLAEVAVAAGCSKDTIRSRVTDWRTFKKDVMLQLNHQVVSIEVVDAVEMFDMTVADFANFATTTCFIHNCMDQDPIIASALDIYADESTVKNEYGDILTINSDNGEIKDVLHNLFYDILNIEFNLWPWVRNLCKYGDFFMFLEITPEYGIHNVMPLSHYDTVRVEGSDLKNPHYVYFETLGANGFKQKFENYELAHFRMLSDTNFLPYGKCLTKNVYVDTETGTQTIDTLEVGQRVWVWNGVNFELSPILNTIASGRKDIIEVSTPRRSIQASGNHPLLIWDDARQSTIYKNVEDIKIGDLLIASSNAQLVPVTPTINKNLPTDFNKNGWKNNIDNVPNVMTEEFAQLFGFLVGDGWLVQNYSVVFAQGTDVQMNNMYTQLLEKFSGKSAHYSSVTYTDVNIPAQVMVHSRMLATVLANNGFSGKFDSKRIPAWVFSAPYDIQKAFITGLIDADGSVFVDEWKCIRYTLEVNNEMLVRDVQHLLHRMNVKVGKVSTRTRENITIKGIDVKTIAPSFYIYFYLDGAEVKQVRKYDRKLGHFVFTEPVVRLESLGKHDTYDIQVESEHSNFIANGLVVHNSEIESARRIFRQLILMEDAMMIHRIMRAPEKRVFKIDIGNIPPHEVDTFIQKLMDRTKKVPFMDEQTGDYNLRYNMQNLMEDFYLPVRGGDSGTSIENLAGLEFNPIEDIEYLRNKMMAALKIPKAFLGYDENVNGKATLAAEDVRFARTIERIQRIVVSELQKIAMVHLYAQGYTDEELVNFSLELTNPSTIYEQEKINLWQQKITLVTQMQSSKMFSSDWIYKNVFNMPEDDYVEERQRIVIDTKRAFRLAQIEQGVSDPMKFGFPQDRTPDANAAIAATSDGANALGADLPPGSAPSTGGQGAPQTLDDLPTEEELGLTEEGVEEDDEDGRGQPAKPPQYAQDSHVRGRDPLGFKQRYSALHVAQKRKAAPRTGLSLEARNLLKGMDNKFGVSDSRWELLSEHSLPHDDSGSMLDEKNILTNLEDM